VVRIEIAVLVPVLSRPANAAPLAASLAAATTTPYRLAWLCSPGDDEQIAACHEAGGEVMVMGWKPDRADFAMKIDHGFTHTSEPWLFQGADDLRFTRGWEVHALSIGEARGAGVVGTNDLGNPLVKRGIHSTHTFFSRAYIEQQGGTVDGSGLVFSHAYSHEYCDSEFIETAKSRGQFVMSKRSVVEHLHPHWGKAEMDSTYEKATANSDKDRLLFVQRMRSVRTPQARRALREQKRLARRGAR
jgi:hypothetical protein